MDYKALVDNISTLFLKFSIGDVVILPTLPIKIKPYGIFLTRSLLNF